MFYDYSCLGCTQHGDFWFLHDNVNNISQKVNYNSLKSLLQSGKQISNITLRGRNHLYFCEDNIISDNSFPHVQILNSIVATNLEFDIIGIVFNSLINLESIKDNIYEYTKTKEMLIGLLKLYYDYMKPYKRSFKSVFIVDSNIKSVIDDSYLSNIENYLNTKKLDYIYLAKDYLDKSNNIIYTSYGICFLRDYLDTVYKKTINILLNTNHKYLSLDRINSTYKDNLLKDCFKSVNQRIKYTKSLIKQNKTTIDCIVNSDLARRNDYIDTSTSYIDILDNNRIEKEIQDILEKYMNTLEIVNIDRSDFLKFLEACINITSDYNAGYGFILKFIHKSGDFINKHVARNYVNILGGEKIYSNLMKLYKMDKYVYLYYIANYDLRKNMISLTSSNYFKKLRYKYFKYENEKNETLNYTKALVRSNLLSFYCNDNYIINICI